MTKGQTTYHAWHFRLRRAVCSASLYLSDRTNGTGAREPPNGMESHSRPLVGPWGVPSLRSG